MDHHHAGAFIAIGAAVFASMIGAAVAIFAAMKARRLNARVSPEAGVP